MLVPLGAWCRTAYQVGHFVEKHGGRKKSYPFDWTITPFLSLEKTLTNHFDPFNVLQVENLKLSKFSSIADQPSALIFHHDLSEHVVADHLKRGSTNAQGIPLSLLNDTEKVQNARARFIHTYSNLCTSISQAHEKDERIGFVRWLRGGHPDRTLPEAFEGETINTLWELLADFCQTKNIAVLQVISKVNRKTDSPDVKLIPDLSDASRGAVVTIMERRGWNGDGSNSYRGDNDPWEVALTWFTREFSIPIT